jgi:hypothetical protein
VGSLTSHNPINSTAYYGDSFTLPLLNNCKENFSYFDLDYPISCLSATGLDVKCLHKHPFFIFVMFINFVHSLTYMLTKKDRQCFKVTELPAVLQRAIRFINFTQVTGLVHRNCSDVAMVTENTLAVYI